MADLKSHNITDDHINHFAQNVLSLCDGCYTCAMEFLLHSFACIATQPAVQENIPPEIIRAGLDNTFKKIMEQPDGRSTTH